MSLARRVLLARYGQYSLALPGLYLCTPHLTVVSTSKLFTIAVLPGSFLSANPKRKRSLIDMRVYREAAGSAARARAESSLVESGGGVEWPERL